MAPPKELNFITGNKNKLAEVQAILSETAVDLRSQAVDLVEIQGTIEEISRDKAIRAAEAVSLFFFLPFSSRRLLRLLFHFYYECLKIPSLMEM
jgi:hypothetical protein